MGKIKLKDLIYVIREFTEIGIYDRNGQFLLEGFIESDDFDFSKFQNCDVIKIRVSQDGSILVDIEIDKEDKWY